MYEVIVRGCKVYHRSFIISDINMFLNTLRTGLFKLFKRPFPGFLTILTLYTLN